MSWHYRPNDAPSEADDGQTIFSVAHYLLYWKLDVGEREAIAEHRTTAYAASNALRKVKPGDVLWIVNVQQGHLYLIGRLQVEFVVDDTAIAQELVDPQPDTWYEADWYAISNRYNIEPMRVIDITGVAPQLRFNSPVAPMLDVAGGRVDAHQLTGLRQIMAETSEMLDDIWYNDAYVPNSVEDYLELTEDDQAYAEGKAVVRTVRQRQRSRALVNQAKAQFRSLHDGRLFCEVCGFDYEDTYGVDYIEAHHTKPIASLEDETANTTEAVVMLCANCHRIAHTRTPPYSVDELRQMINHKGNTTNDDNGNY